MNLIKSYKNFFSINESEKAFNILKSEFKSFKVEGGLFEIDFFEWLEFAKKHDGKLGSINLEETSIDPLIDFIQECGAEDLRIIGLYHGLIDKLSFSSYWRHLISEQSSVYFNIPRIGWQTLKLLFEEDEDSMPEELKPDGFSYEDGVCKFYFIEYDDGEDYEDYEDEEY